MPLRGAFFTTKQSRFSWCPWWLSGLLLCVSLLLAACSTLTTHTPPVAAPSLTASLSPTPSVTPQPTALPSSTPTLRPLSVVEGPGQKPTPSASPTASIQLCSPLDWETIPELAEIVSDPYAPPPPGRDERHHGVDFSHYSRKGHPSMQGEPIQAILAGRVAAAIHDRLPYGNMVIIETAYADLPAGLAQTIGLGADQSLYLLYAHFESPPQVELGESVACGQVLGAVGTSGYNVVNAHLHLEARRGPPGAVFGGMAFYTTNATPIEMENYQRWRTSGEFEHFDPLVLFSEP